MEESTFFLDLSTRQPCVLLLDVPANADIKRLDQVNQALRAIKSSTHIIGASVELAVVDFGTEVCAIQDFGSLENFEDLTVDANTRSHNLVCAGILRALDYLETLKAEYNEYGVPYRRPWIFILASDTQLTEDSNVQEVAKQRLSNAINGRHASVVAVVTADKPWSPEFLEAMGSGEWPDSSIARLDSNFYTNGLIELLRSTVLRDHKTNKEPGSGGVAWHDPTRTAPEPRSPAQEEEALRKLAETITIQTAWQIMGSSVKGTSHEKSGTPCQDAHKWKTTDGGWLVMAVADGAGSAAFSDVGAEIAVSEVVRLVVERIEGAPIGSMLSLDDTAWRSFFAEAFRLTKVAIESKAGAINQPSRELACTLIVVVLSPNYVIAAQVGDGCAVMQREDGALCTLTHPTVGEYVNEALFLVSPGALDSMQFASGANHARAAACFSDGLQMLAMKYPTWEPYPRFFEPLFKFVNEHGSEEAAQLELGSLLTSARVRERSDDDITLVIATRQSLQGATGA